MKWSMKAVLCFVVIGLGSVATDMAGECSMAGFYLELGCTPVPSTDNSTCPEAFTCPDLHPDRSKCYYRGVSYEDRASIPQNLILNPCTRACRCRITDEPRVDCASVDCFDTFNADAEKQCIPTYELDSCCSAEPVCGKDDIAKLKQCEVDGQMYYEGQRFEPKNTRKSCICTPEWDGKVDNSSYCKDVNCGLELHYQNNILDNCAPEFAGSDRTCPINFICPSPETKVVRGLNIRNINAQCVFGNETMTVGDELTVGEKCVKCICKVPPFVTCNRINVCGEIVE